MKWYREVEGYGFITAEDGHDCFFHFRQIQNARIDQTVRLLPGDPVEVVDRGPRAILVTKL